jgi:hypothetical protein
MSSSESSGQDNGDGIEGGKVAAVTSRKNGESMPVHSTSRQQIQGADRLRTVRLA